MPTEKLATILADIVDTSPAIAIRTPIDIVAAIFLASVTILSLIALYVHKKKHKTDKPTNTEQ